MRVISFCADGIKTAAENGFYDWVVDQDADFICIQDLRAQEYELQADLFHPQGYIICGSWSIAHRDQDVQSLNGATGKYGFLDEERQWLDILYRDLGYSDAFRRINSDHDEFTWWPDGNRAANGWRTDFQIISGGVRNRVDYGAIYKTKAFSNHAPLIMDYELEI